MGELLLRGEEAGVAVSVVGEGKVEIVHDTLECTICIHNTLTRQPTLFMTCAVTMRESPTFL